MSASGVQQVEALDASTRVVPDEQDLLRSLEAGDAHGVAALYQVHGARMVAFAQRYVTDRGAAEDVVVTLLGKWLEHPPRVGGADRLDAFLATSVYHAAIDWTRRERLEQGRPPRSSPTESSTDRRRAGPVAAVEAVPSREALRARLEVALERLSAGERLLLESHYGHALSADECMRDLGISRAAFHQRLHRARTRLARLLSQDEATP